MANKAKYLFFSACFIVGGLVGYSSHASLPTITDELYSEGLYKDKNPTEIPQALESSAHDMPAAAQAPAPIMAAAAKAKATPAAPLMASMNTGSAIDRDAMETLLDADDSGAAPAVDPEAKHTKKHKKHSSN
jgi:hypothetical protein